MMPAAAVTERIDPQPVAPAAFAHSLRHRAIWSPAGEGAPSRDRRDPAGRANPAPFAPLTGFAPIVIRREHPAVTTARDLAARFGGPAIWGIVLALCLGIFGRVALALIPQGWF